MAGKQCAAAEQAKALMLQTRPLMRDNDLQSPDGTLHGRLCIRLCNVHAPHVQLEVAVLRRSPLHIARSGVVSALLTRCVGLRSSACLGSASRVESHRDRQPAACCLASRASGRRACRPMRNREGLRLRFDEHDCRSRLLLHLVRGAEMKPAGYRGDRSAGPPIAERRKGQPVRSNGSAPFARSRCAGGG